ncbi:NAD(P)-dependent oxidoreductase [Paenibacillus radicis (ex Gao et al. 2016)]|uniref:dTDP-4-dehydrorhamnose reductase n=1 Tax=Paenibacillus radicis (ex Gao et al. 2016) TaxID=1737354 RepID=A0A917GZU5_9BACL|nr:dTDP-4-dehydrorhamnose reductase [Paenibacillus radicis (ex Gao et al. 2016)]GGG63372.1 NAD(P)-dependent oxidoreductase [Paenibacillus radicis (ex Gao et al. 2016)]
MTVAKIKIVVTGANGQLGRELVEGKFEENTVEIIGFSRNELDITNLLHCRDVLAKHRPDIVIHCAAYTAVDQAESEPDEAFRVNSAGTRNVAVAAREIGAKLCYISTDYVFDGTATVPYNEFDRTHPQTVYGKSKLAGEFAVQTLHDRFFIVRTSWVFGKYGNNFVKTMLRLGKEKDRLKVVADQIGSPTYTYDLAAFLIELVQTDYYGIYHVSNTESCSWFGFAKAIFEDSSTPIHLEPCTTEEFPRPAPRPFFSVMDHSAIRSNGFTPLRPWREALQHFLKDCE